MNYYYSNVYNHEGKKELLESNSDLAEAPTVAGDLVAPDVVESATTPAAIETAPAVAPEVTAPVVVNNIDPGTVSTDPLANPY